MRDASAPGRGTASVVAWAIIVGAVLAGSPTQAQIIVRGEGPIPPAAVIRGHVRGGATGRGVPDAFVAQVDVGAGAFTDRDGGFEVTLPSEAPPVLVVGKPGYRTVSFELPDSVISRPLVLNLPPAPGEPERPSPSLEGIYGRMVRAPREGETLVARLGPAEIEDAGRTAVDAILDHTDDSVDRCSNGSICSSVYGGARGIVRAREILLCVDGRWFERSRDVVGNLIGARRPDAVTTQIELLEGIPAEEIFGAEIFRLARRRAGPVPYRVHIYTRGFMAANLARDAVQRPPFRC